MGDYAALTLRHKIYQTFCSEGESIEEFINKFKAWQDELQLISKQLASKDFYYLLMLALPES
jgi:hypothetical protein